jgi:hypothetical protein
MIVIFIIMMANWARGRPRGKLLCAALISASLAPAAALLSGNPAEARSQDGQQVASNALKLRPSFNP